MGMIEGWNSVWNLHPWRCSKSNQSPEQPALVAPALSRWVWLGISRDPSAKLVVPHRSLYGWEDRRGGLDCRCTPSGLWGLNGGLPLDPHLRPAHHLLLSVVLRSEFWVSLCCCLSWALWDWGCPFPSRSLIQLDSCPLGNRRQAKGIPRGEQTAFTLCRCHAINATF